MRIDMELFIESYISHPYWPEREKVINITKESGMARARSSANRRKALQEYLEAHDMTLADFEALEALADRPWHLSEDGHIIVPKRSVDGMLTQAADQARAAFRAFPADMARTACRATSWVTDATPDQACEWERFVVVTAGTGAKLSNQRAIRRNWFIGNCPPDDTLVAGPKVTATSHVEIDEEMVKPDTLRNMLRWAGQWVGIGASRKMGWGRFSIREWDIKA
jgi:hypothetical protein